MKPRRLEWGLWVVLIGTVLFLVSSAYLSRMPGQFTLLP